MRKREPNFKKLSKKIINKKIRKKINKIKNKKERTELYEYSIKSSLEIIVHNLENKLKEIKDKDKYFFTHTKVSLLKNKIRYFLINYCKRERKYILKQIKEIKKEI